MNAPHTEGHEALLVAALADDSGEHVRELEARLANCSECRARFEELTAVRALLDQAGREERETLAELDLTATVPGSDTVAPLVRKLASQRQHRLRSSRLRLVTLLVASAAAAVLFVGWLVRVLVPDRPGDHRGTTLGQTHTGQHSPKGTGQSFELFKWDDELPDGGTFDLVISDPSKSADDAVLLIVRGLEANQCSVPPERTSTWPARIRWELRLYDATHQPLPGGFSESAER